MSSKEDVVFDDCGIPIVISRRHSLERAVIEAAKEWRQNYAEYQASKWTALGAVVSFESNLRQSEASLIKALDALIKAEENTNETKV